MDKDTRLFGYFFQVYNRAKCHLVFRLNCLLTTNKRELTSRLMYFCKSAELKSLGLGFSLAGDNSFQMGEALFKSHYGDLGHGVSFAELVLIAK
jgi:hypothetical protein